MTTRGPSCIVLGGGGFLGVNLCRRLAASGRRVRAFGRRCLFPQALAGVGPFQVAAKNRGIIAALITSNLEFLRKPPEMDILRDHRLVGIALDVASVTRRLTRSWKLAAAVIVSSALMHMGNVLAIFVLARAASVGIDFIATTAVALAAMLIALMPIAHAGWGVREGSMIVGYGCSEWRRRPHWRPRSRWAWRC